MSGPNPEGLLALEQHRHKTFFGGPGQRQCNAKSRRTGQRCKAIPLRGKDVCRHHGGHSNGRGIKKPTEARTPRQQRNYYARIARHEAVKNLDVRILHPETMTIFRQQYARLVPSADAPMFILSLDARLQGNIDHRAWRETVEAFTRYS